jgi:hypothetical protein
MSHFLSVCGRKCDINWWAEHRDRLTHVIQACGVVESII